MEKGRHQVFVKESDSCSEFLLPQEGAILAPGAVINAHSTVDSQVIAFDYQIRQRTIQEVQQIHHNRRCDCGMFEPEKRYRCTECAREGPFSGDEPSFSGRGGIPRGNLD